MKYVLAVIATLAVFMGTSSAVLADGATVGDPWAPPHAVIPPSWGEIQLPPLVPFANPHQWQLRR